MLELDVVLWTATVENKVWSDVSNWLVLLYHKPVRPLAMTRDVSYSTVNVWLDIL